MTITKEITAPEKQLTKRVGGRSIADTVRWLRSCVRCAEFDKEPELLLTVAELVPALKPLKQSDPITYLSGLGVCAQIYDYFGLREKAKAVVATEGASLLNEMSLWTPPQTDQEHSLLKLKVWMILHYATTHFYRFNNYESALMVADKSREIVRTMLRSLERPCHGTNIRISFFRGQILRQQSEYPQAFEAFQDCMRHTHSNLQWREYNASTDADKVRLAEEMIRSNRNTALCLALGFGWIYSAQGLLEKAMPLLEGARVMLASTNDWINQAYVNLLYGRVMRAMAGTDANKLKEAEGILLKAHSSFGHHESYKSRAAYELSLAYLYSGQYAKSMSKIRDVAKSAKKSRDTRWQARAMIVASRIQRREGWDLPRAMELAEGAVQLAEEGKQVDCEIEALIARGEARLLHKDYAAAREDFRRALELAKNNYQTQAVCHLQLAKTSLLLDNWKMAQAHFSEWNSVKTQIENKAVHLMADDVRDEMDRWGDEFRVFEDDDLNLRNHEIRVFGYLLRKAKKKNLQKAECAKALGIARATFIKKERELAKLKKPKSTDVIK